MHGIIVPIVGLFKRNGGEGKSMLDLSSYITWLNVPSMGLFSSRWNLVISFWDRDEQKQNKKLNYHLSRLPLGLYFYASLRISSFIWGGKDMKIIFFQCGTFHVMEIE